MKTSIRVGSTLITALLACGLVACTSQATNSGGTGGTTAPAGTGGTTAPAGTGGTGTAGTTGTVSADGKLCPPPAGALITDFTPGSGETTQVHFGNSTTFAGGEYAYPAPGGTPPSAYPLTSDVTGGDWHISGTVGDYSGFGLYFDNCTTVDASAYKGISFKISGDGGSFGGITFGVDTLNDSISAAWLNSHDDKNATTPATNPGRCTPSADPTLNQYSQTVCANSTASIPVTADPITQTILWADFTGGKPKPVEPAEIKGIHWSFAWTAGGSSYPVDIKIDDLSFIP